MSTAIKFCGMTREADIEIACALGIDYIGLVLAESHRQLTCQRAADLAVFARNLQPEIRIVALVRDQPAHFVAEAVERVGPDLLQFHGSEDDTFCRQFGRPHWKALGMAGAPDVVRLAAGHPSASALVLDSHGPGAGGGTGASFDWRLWPKLDRSLVLAGGLNADNVAQAIEQTRPFAVDVASGIESAPGIKDAGRMRAFVEAVAGTR